MVLRIEELNAEAADAASGDLAEVLVDCVTGGASVSFMLPFGAAEALAYWRGVAEGVRAGKIVLLGAALDGRWRGTVQLHPAWQPNQPHRADIAKMLVHGAARRRGLARALMAEAEAAARRHGRTLLTLDTCAGTDADRLYPQLGFVRSGIIPGYALTPDGGNCDTVIYWKRLS